ncbi:nucleotidyltransferase family protein [Streptomyces sp. NPDC001537]
MISRLPLDDQLDSLRAVLSRNSVLTEVLERTATMALPGWYLTAGCLFQTVWNVVTDRPPTAGIKDYDVFYFDADDLSWEAEDAVIKAGREIFADLPAEVEIRNEARVHLWYEDRFGVPCPPYESSEAAIDSFAATTCCLGVRLEAGGRWRVYAPHGLSDVFNLVLRPNPVLAPRSVYEAKAARWREQWPELTVLDWPDRDSSMEHP